MEHPLEKVMAWLEAGADADYQAGVLLLQAHGGNRSLVTTLLKKDSAGHREKLRYELIKVGCGGRLQDVSEVLSHFAQAVSQAVQSTSASMQEGVGKVAMPGPVVEEPAPATVPEALQGQVDELTQRMQRLYNQRCQVSNGLAELAPEKGPRVVGEILRLQDQYNALAEQRRRLVAGELAVDAAALAPEADPLVDRGELVKSRQNLRSNLSKARKKLEEAKTDAKKSELAQKIGQLSVELASIEMQLALPRA